MPPAKTIIVDREAMLAGIAAALAEDLQGIKGDMSSWSRGERQRAASNGWTWRDLARWAGRPLTASERIRHQQALRQLEADGLVAIDARYVRLFARPDSVCGADAEGKQPMPADDGGGPEASGGVDG